MSKPWSEMTARERDAAIAERLGWRYNPLGDVWERPGLSWIGCNQWSPTTDHTAARLVEDAIERRGLLIDYLYKLYDMLGKFLTHEDYISIKDVAVMLRATPDQRCEAAWRAMGGE